MKKAVRTPKNKTEMAFVSYAVDDLKRARKFYEGVLLLKPTSVWEGEGMGFIEYDLGANTLAIGKGAPNFTPGKQGGTVALEVSDFESTVARLRNDKVIFITEPHETSVCFMALIADSEGNQLMIHKRKNS